MQNLYTNEPIPQKSEKKIKKSKKIKVGRIRRIILTQLIISLVIIFSIVTIKHFAVGVYSMIEGKIKYVFESNISLADLSEFVDLKIRENEPLSTFFNLEGYSATSVMNIPRNQILPPIVKPPVEKVLVEKVEVAETMDSIVDVKEEINCVFPLDGVITSTYAGREDPFYDETAGTEQYEFHTGIDISAATSKKILAYTDGEVIRVAYSPSYGNHVLIQHSDNMKTLYAHCEKAYVKVGQKVKTSEIIAKAGSTGRSTAPHLHFEVRIDDEATDPTPYLK